MSDELKITLLPSPRKVTITTTRKAAVATLQGVWDVETDANKNTFVDNNTFEILKFIHDGQAATDALARFTGLVLAEESAMAKFVDILDTFGYWALIDDFVSYRLQTEANSLIGFKLKTHTVVNAPTHTPGTGFLLNGTTQYIDTNYNPTTDAVSYTQDDSMIGAFINTITLDSTNRQLFSHTDNAHAQQRTTTQTRYVLNGTSGTNRTGINMANDMLVLITKIAASGTNNIVYQNGSSVLKIPVGTVAPANENIRVGAFSTSAARFFNGSVGAFVVGAGIGFDVPFFHAQLKILNSELAAI